MPIDMLDDDGYSFVARMNNSRSLYQILKTLHFNDLIVLSCNVLGVRATVEDGKCVQATAFISKELFDEYKLNKDEELTFSVNLPALLECLNIFGTGSSTGDVSTTLKICYAGHGQPLILLLQEDDVLTDCTIQTLEADDVIDFDFASSDDVNNIIIKAEFLREAFQDMDMSSEEFELTMSPNKPNLRLSTFGQIGTFHIDFTDESDAIESVDCPNTKTSRYNMGLLKSLAKPLLSSHRVSIRANDRDFLCMQYMVKVDDDKVCFVELYCSPRVEEAT